MSTTPIAISPSEPWLSIRRAGTICLWSGLLGAASGVYLSVVEPAVPDDRFSYPLAAGPFVAIQLWFAVQHLGLALGQEGLRWAEVFGDRRPARWGHVVGVAGMLLLAATEVVAVIAADAPLKGSRADLLNVLYGVSTFACGVGLVAVGIATVRQNVLTGWARWMPLALGAWVFVPMTPAIASGYLAARLSITGWMLLYAALGWALRSHPGSSGDAGDASR